MSLRCAATVLVLMCLALMAGCGESAPTGIPAATAIPTGTDVPPTNPPKLLTATPLPSPTPKPTKTPRPTDTASPTPTALATPDTTLPTPSATAPPRPLKKTDVLTITVVYDNNAYDERLKTEWGFAALVEYGEHTLLFDTGGDGPTLLGNMAQLGLDPQVIEVVVLSHEHGDHTGGLGDLLDTGVKPTVYVPAAFPTHFKEDVRTHTALVEVGDPMEILPGMYSTGQLGSTIVEQALVVQTQKGIVVITGCAHPGIVEMVRQAREVTEGEVALVVGGFHLGRASRSELERILMDFRQLGVQHVAPTHCTGEAARAAFAKAYGDDYIPTGVGRVIVVGSGPTGNIEAPANPR
jgi:7,8-dihydropterin-6-yl-methyl-4-(beta-D-ribofuranosyl)aminobenzene 5'-phosphate synthase